jgi:hypothetical protein
MNLRAPGRPTSRRFNKCLSAIRCRGPRFAMGGRKYFARWFGRCRMLRYIERPHRHDGGNGVLINELLRASAQNQAILIERLDMALQLDPIRAQTIRKIENRVGS